MLVAAARSRGSIAFILALGLSLALCGSARAELPPGAYEELQRDAQEKLLIRIEKVDEKPAESNGERKFVCTAKVVGVERSKADLKAGDSIQFESYYIPKEVRQRGWAGPQVPPLVKAGWQGRIYLNRSEESANYTLAAYGRSFVPITGNLEAQSTPKLGIHGRDSNQGGVQIDNVFRDSLADDLGLRSGDRLTELNGQPINAIEHIAPALAADKSRLSVKVFRGGRLLELSMARN